MQNLDQVTQANAGAVEETVSAAAALLDTAEQLAHRLAVFTVAGPGAGRSRAA